jgi:hypothetical protein
LYTLGVPEISSHEPKLKEILYRCLEDLKATKAALYLMLEGEDSYRLVTHYGFRDLSRRDVSARDEVVDRLIVKRAPFFVNGLMDDSRFSEMLFNSETTRMLIAPIYVRGKLVGFLDIRDKAAKEPFANPDLPSVQRIADQFLDFFTQSGMYGQKTPTLTNVRTPSQETIVPFPGASEAPAAAAAAVEESKRAIARGIHRARTMPEALTEGQVGAGAAVLPSLLTLPGVVVAAFSSFGRLGGYQVVAATADLSAEAMKQFQSKLHGWLQKHEETEGITRTQMVLPYGKGARAIEPQRLASMLSAPVVVGSMKGLVLTVAFEAAPSPSVRALLNDYLTQMQQAVEHAISHEILQTRNQKTAEKLLEPDFQTFPVLAAHSRRVSELAERVSIALGLPSSEIESTRIAALLHDVGMRLLDYRNLYRKQAPTSDELKLLREHPVVGAALVADSPLGGEAANLILAHHERPDGTGYPGGLSGEAIPLGARIIHVCEAFDAMTAADSYQTAVPAAAALAKIKRAAGAQFDEAVALKFVDLMSTSN